ncbi:unnamed protein product [Cylicocyclus nassatus]|uniref:acid phosphatase n=1 Tax=Cylicocyclus nassatus TaxID=53992 RepID=A0AA36H5Z0_CYLNA|nr:unnamed protein product [Cylicocyclus nassatus]
MMLSLYILLVFGSPIIADSTDKLISAIVLFRHGDRAPYDRLSNESYRSYFPYGLGRLTPKGIEHTYELGTFLRQRYVDTGFLQTPLHAEQVYFRSKANDRCLMSASLVAQAMFNNGSDILPVAPIFSQESKDWLLSGDLICDEISERIQAKCNRTPKPHYEQYTEFQGLVFECLGLHKNNTIFPTGKSFELAESLISEDKNGLPMPKWYEEHRDEIYKYFLQVENFIAGAAQYHSPKSLRMHSGYLLHSILDKFNASWARFSTHGTLETKKFVAISTQDWLMQAFMDSLGIRAASLGESTYPPFNSLIILELHLLKNEPVIKAFYRDHLNATVSDVTASIRNCHSKDACPLKNVLSCCDDYINLNPEETCHASHAEELSMNNGAYMKVSPVSIFLLSIGLLYWLTFID